MYTYIHLCLALCILQAEISSATFVNGTVYYTNSTQQTTSTSTTSPVTPAGSVTLSTQLLTSAPGSSLTTTFSTLLVGTQSVETSLASLSSNTTHGFESTVATKNDSIDSTTIQRLLPLSSVGVGAYILHGLGSSSVEATQPSINTSTPDASASRMSSMNTSTSTHDTILPFTGPRYNASSVIDTISASTLASANYSSPSHFSISAANVTFAARVSGTVIPLTPVLPTSRATLNATHVAITGIQNSTSRASLYLPKPSGNAWLYPENANVSYWKACQASYVAWSEIFQPNVTTSTVTRTESNHSLTFHATYGHANVYTTISGYPRAHGTLTPTSVTQYVTRYLRTSIETHTHTSIRNASVASPSPTCAIATAQCSVMWQTYLGSLGLPTNIANVTEPRITPMPSNRPRCALGDLQSTCSTPSSEKEQCQLEAGFGQIFYWPSSVIDDLNGTSKSNTSRTQHHNTAKPITAMFWNATMTYPSVYLFIDGLSTRASTASSKHCVTISPLGASTMGVSTRSASNKGHDLDMLLTLLELEPTGLSSLIRDLGPGVNTASAASAIAHGGQDYQKWMQRIVANTVLWNNATTAAYQVKSIDYRHLGAPPAEAYYLRPDGAPGCNVRGPHPQCSTIFDGAYVPQLAVPTQIRAIDPSFADCAIPLFGKFGKPQPMVSGGQYGSDFKKHPEQVHTSVSTVQAPCTYTCRGCCGPHGGGNSPLAPHTLISDMPEDTPTFASSASRTTKVPTRNNAPTNVPAPMTTEASSSPAEVTLVDATTQTGGATAAAIIMSLLTSDVGQDSQVGATSAPVIAPIAISGTQAQNANPNAVSVLSAALQTQAAGSPASQPQQPEAGGDGGSLDSTIGGAMAATAQITPALPAAQFDSTTLGMVQAQQTNHQVAEPASTASAAVFSVADSAYTLHSGSNTNVAVVGSAMLTVGGQAQTLSGQTVSAVPGGVMVNGQPILYSAPEATKPTAQAALVTIGSQVLAAAQMGSPGTVQLDGSILSVGGAPATIAGQIVSLATAGLVLQAGGQASSTIVLGPAPSLTAHAFPVTLGSQTLTAAEVGSGTFRLGSTTLSISGPAATISGQTVSAAASGLVVNGQALAVEDTTSSQSGVVLSASSHIFTAAEVQPGLFALGTTTISAGGPVVTAGGETISAVGPGLVVNGRTQLASAFPISTTRGVQLSQDALTATATEASPGVFVLASQTISAGGPAARISGQTISAVPSGLVIAGQTITASVLPSGSQASVVDLEYLGLPKATEISTGVFLLGSTTLSVGGPALTTSGHTISAAASGLVADGTMYTASSLRAINIGAVFTEVSSPATASEIAPGVFVVGTAILTAGGAAKTIPGHMISAGPSGIVVDGTSYAASGLTALATGVEFTEGTSVTTATEIAPGVFVVGTATLTAGGPAKTISGRTISAAPSGIVVDGTSYAASALLPSPTGLVLTEGTTPITATEIAPGTFVLGSATLSVGGSATTIFGRKISAASSGLVIDGQTITASAIPSRATSGVLLTKSFQQLTATELRPGVFALGSLTLTAGGPAATIASETISAMSNGLVVDGQTISASLLKSTTTSATLTTTQVSMSVAHAPTRSTQPAASSTQKPKKSSAARIELCASMAWAAVCMVLVGSILN